MRRLEGKRAIVTGAGRGIGRAIAEKFLAEGGRLVVCDLVADRLAATATALRRQGEIHDLAGDVTDGAFCQALVDCANDRLGGIDILVNNAGIAVVEPFLDHSLAAWNRTLAVNLTAVFQLGQLVARSMFVADHGGAIVNMASSNGIA
ncbi:MAG TPA: SDR family NAD(P)-dependent oxidoreductase, partial [Thermomicrobiales bacterium]|nr:SDR family NAD(P)-dependent oxidoreductase [Thermomicrobiales bacterium]